MNSTTSSPMNHYPSNNLSSSQHLTLDDFSGAPMSITRRSESNSSTSRQGDYSASLVDLTKLPAVNEEEELKQEGSFFWNKLLGGSMFSGMGGSSNALSQHDDRSTGVSTATGGGQTSSSSFYNTSSGSSASGDDGMFGSTGGGNSSSSSSPAQTVVHNGQRAIDIPGSRPSAAEQQQSGGDVNNEQPSTSSIGGFISGLMWGSSASSSSSTSSPTTATPGGRGNTGTQYQQQQHQQHKKPAPPTKKLPKNRLGNAEELSDLAAFSHRQQMKVQDKLDRSSRAAGGANEPSCPAACPKPCCAPGQANFPGSNRLSPMAGRIGLGALNSNFDGCQEIAHSNTSRGSSWVNPKAPFSQRGLSPNGTTGTRGSSYDDDRDKATNLMDMLQSLDPRSEGAMKQPGHHQKASSSAHHHHTHSANTTTYGSVTSNSDRFRDLQAQYAPSPRFERQDHQNEDWSDEDDEDAEFKKVKKRLNARKKKKKGTVCYCPTPWGHEIPLNCCQCVVMKCTNVWVWKI